MHILFLLAALLLSQGLPFGTAQQCASGSVDYSVSYNGVPYFTVNRTTGSCSCGSFSATGSSSLASATVGNLTVTGSTSINGLCSAACLQTMASNISSLQATINAQAALISAMQTQITRLAALGVRSCKQLQTDNAPDVLPSGTYKIWTPANGPTDVYCDMATAGGGWTQVWKQPAVDLNTTNYAYNAYLSGGESVMSRATEMMFAYSDSNNVLNSSSAWRFDMPPAFATVPPMGVGHCGYYLITAVRVSDGHTTTQYLRAGYSNFGTKCDEGCYDGAHGQGTSLYGQICLTTKPASQLGWRSPDAGISVDPYGYLNFPHYSSFAVAGDDGCSDSDQNYGTVVCSSSRLFAIFAR